MKLGEEFYPLKSLKRIQAFGDAQTLKGVGGRQLSNMHENLLWLGHTM